MAYSPKYISQDDVPVQIPDDFSEQEKLDAIELAEGMLELDLNDGQELNVVTVVHEAAIKQRATCELAKGSEHPDDVSLGDLDDDGTTKSDYAHEAFCNSYKVLKDKIKAFMDDDGGHSPYVYNTDKSKDRKEWDRFVEQIDIDKSEDFARRDSW